MLVNDLHLSDYQGDSLSTFLPSVWLVNAMRCKREARAEVRYPVGNVMQLAEQITLQAKRKIRTNSTSSVGKLKSKKALLNKKLRLCRAINNIISHIPKENGEWIYQMNGFDLHYERDEVGVMIAGVVGGLKGDDSTTIVTAVSSRSLKSGDLPVITPGMVDMARAVMAHGSIFNHYVIKE